MMHAGASFDHGPHQSREIFDFENGSVIVAGHRIHDHNHVRLLTVSEILSKSSELLGSDCHAPGAPKFTNYPRLWDLANRPVSTAAARARVAEDN